MSYQNAESTAPARLGRYELLGQLAVGGMAEIHLARLAGEAGFEKIVVVKRLLPELVASRAFVAMFLDEGKLVARLDHPNICEVHELGKDGAEYFLVMPYLDGVPVTDLVARPRDPDRITQLRVATGVIAQACVGLHHAHELRDADGTPAALVHRDVSPSNLFVTVSGLVKVLDFGIAKVRGAAETEVGTVKGKTQYMAPEQLLGEPLDRRCDVFALGIVLYELATHQRLFKRASDYLAARAILEEPIPSAHEADPAIPEALSRVIARALARAPADRYPDARALAAALDDAMAPHGGIATAPQIAVAIADQHAEELSAQRTRQARVLGTATMPLAAATKPARPRAGSSGAPAAELDPAAGPDTTLVAVARRPFRWRFFGSALVIASALAIVLWIVSTRGRHDGAADRDGSSADRLAVDRGSDGRGSDSRGSDGRVADDRMADDRMADNRMADNRMADNRVPGNRTAAGSDTSGWGSDTSGRSSDLTGRLSDTDGRGSDGRGPDGRAPDGRVSDGGALDRRGSDGRVADNRTAAGSDTSGRGSDGRAMDGRGSNGRGSDGRASDGRGSNGRVSELRASGRGSAGRGSDASGSDARGDARKLASDGARKSGSAGDVAPAKGWFSIESKPFGHVFVDDREFGVTPLVHKSLAAGRHKVRVVLEDGRTKDMVVVVPPGKAAAPITLQW